MIEVLKQRFNENMPNEQKANRVREFLQVLVLKIMHDKRYFENLAFVGGTALRLLYDLKRFSEDLDFSLIDKSGYDFTKVMQKIESELRLHGLNTEIKPKETKTVQSAFVKFAGLLKELELSNLEEQKLSIKIEIDSNPPKGWKLQTSLVNKGYILNIAHFDLPSLYATKLHACFFRKYVKGRDFYDLLWYIAKKIEPNYNLLNNAIKQTHGQTLAVDKENFKDFLLDKLSGINFAEVKKDAARFLEDKNELSLLDLETIKKSLRSAF